MHFRIWVPVATVIASGEFRRYVFSFPLGPLRWALSLVRKERPPAENPVKLQTFSFHSRW